MANVNTLIAAMAQKCRTMIEQSQDADPRLPREIQPRHLLWMCDRIDRHAEDWPATKLHRWIGYIQCGMIANGMLDLGGAKVMFSEAKDAYGAEGEDRDLIDHLDPDSSFEMDIGGQG